MNDLSIEYLLRLVNDAADASTLESVRVGIVGRKGILTLAMQELKNLDADAKRIRGQELNQIRRTVEELLDKRRSELAAKELQARLGEETIDVSLPVRPQAIGTMHPITRVLEDIRTYFTARGFSVAEGPEVEDDRHNFTALNIPADHPARTMQDTFYLQNKDNNGQPFLLRTHTSPVQIRAMVDNAPPLRIITPGRVYRCDSDMTHTPMFHQVEGLVIEKGIHMGHLKGALMSFLRDFFDVPDLPVRFRPSYFPFTEPSAEVDIGCSRQGGTLKLGDYGDWLEILGCGMVHRNVLSNGGLDPDEWQGFAFGVGVERLAMLKYGIADLRTFFDSDLRWLEYYNQAQNGHNI